MRKAERREIKIKKMVRTYDSIINIIILMMNISSVGY